MIDKSYYKNIPPRNILNDSSNKNITNDSFNYLTDIPLETMIINSNLDDERIIK